MKLHSRMAFTKYEIDELKRKTVNIFAFAAIILVLIIIISLALRPPPSLPTPLGTFYNLNISINGRLQIPEGATVLAAGSKRFIPGLKMTLEIPEIPLAVEKNDREVLLSGTGEFNIAIRELLIMRAPRSMNLRVKLRGFQDFHIKSMAVPSPVYNLDIPDIYLRAKAKNRPHIVSCNDSPEISILINRKGMQI